MTLTQITAICGKCYRYFCTGLTFLSSNSLHPLAMRTLRVGIATTFIWIAMMIFRSPENAAGLMRPWAANLIPMPIEDFMSHVAVADLILGILLLLDWSARFAGYACAVHILSILLVTGITSVTVRNIGLLAGCLAIGFEPMPQHNPAPPSHGDVPANPNTYYTLPPPRPPAPLPYQTYKPSMPTYTPPSTIRPISPPAQFPVIPS